MSFVSAASYNFLHIIFILSRLVFRLCLDRSRAALTPGLLSYSSLVHLHMLPALCYMTVPCSSPLPRTLTTPPPHTHSYSPFSFHLDFLEVFPEGQGPSVCSYDSLHVTTYLSLPETEESMRVGSTILVPLHLFPMPRACSTGVEQRSEAAHVHIHTCTYM